MSKKIYVWDRFIRIFHWSLVLLFLTSYLTGENEHWFHIYSGYAIASLLCLRLVWGFIGSKYAKFNNFTLSPNKIIQYIKDLIKGRSKQHLGHNPLGGLMVIMLLVNLFIIVFSGLKLYAVEEGKGPLAGVNNIQIESVIYADHSDEDEQNKHSYEEDDEGKYEEELWEEIHEAAVTIMIFLIFLHLLGAVISTRIYKESLVKAMITGYKER